MTLPELRALAERLREHAVSQRELDRDWEYLHEAAEALPRLLAIIEAADLVRAYGRPCSLVTCDRPECAALRAYDERRRELP